MTIATRKIFFFCLCLIQCTSFIHQIFPNNPPYPLIQRLSLQDPVFRTLQDDISLFHRSQTDHSDGPMLSLFQYILQEEKDIFSISAHLNLPYEAIATLNNISHGDILHPGVRILVPNQPGLFFPIEPDSDLELILYASRYRSTEKIRIVINTGSGRTEMFFIPGARFNSAERLFYLNRFFRLPLERSVLTSGFGDRADPFLGHQTFHRGIDLAAQSGALVFAAYSGYIAETGYNSIYGNYVRIEHPYNYQSVYAHLSSIIVEQGQEVASGSAIGRVGNTGRSTGPHLHFELFLGSEQLNPEEYLGVTEE
ncbi:MAG: M23 family metallopeptidase [Spirochaetia bacterium]